MSTRSLTVVLDGIKEIGVVYRQTDGNPEVHGRDLYRWFAGSKVVNGTTGDPSELNGVEDLAATLVARMKTSNAGSGVFLYPAGTRGCDEDFTYFLSKHDSGRVYMAIKDRGGRVLYTGLLENFSRLQAKARS